MTSDGFHINTYIFSYLFEHPPEPQDWLGPDRVQRWQKGSSLMQTLPPGWLSEHTSSSDPLCSDADSSVWWVTHRVWSPERMSCPPWSDGRWWDTDRPWTVGRLQFSSKLVWEPSSRRGSGGGRQPWCCSCSYTEVRHIWNYYISLEKTVCLPLLFLLGLHIFLHFCYFWALLYVQ